ncbi:hypothetical protein BJV82DRAFT_632960 [Fennellomyces sp. T-0311]|nr:hypothetical protein BJV82DRAFT_632960 [Fennellomyces sp. T-0311]
MSFVLRTGQKYCCPYSGCTFTMVQQPILYHHVRTCHDANLPPLSNPVFQSSIPEASSSAPLGHLQHQASTVNTMQQNNGTSPRLQTQLPSVTCILQSHQQQQQAPSPPPPRRPRVVAAEPFNLPPQPIPAISTEECRSVLYPPSEKHPHQMIVPTQHRSYPQTCKFPLPEEYQQTSSLQPSQHLRAIAPAPYNPSLQGNWLTSLGGHQSRLHPPPQKRLRVIAPPQLCRFPLAEEHQQVSFSQPPQHPRANAPAQHLSPLQSNQFASVKKGQQTFDPPSQNGPCVVGRAPYDIPLTQSNSSAPTRQQPRAIAPAPYSLPSRPNSFTLAGLPRKRTRRPNQKLLYTNR